MGLKEKLLEKKINDLKQLDRIELQNKCLLAQGCQTSWDSFFTLGIICLFLAISASINVMYLSSHGLSIYYHLKSVRIFSGAGLLFMGFYWLGAIINICKGLKHKERIEEFIEEKSN